MGRQCEIFQEEIKYCDEMKEALKEELIQKYFHKQDCFTIGQYWLPLEFCPWCGNQI